MLDPIQFPIIIRPSFTLGGTGGSVAYNFEEFQSLVEKGLQASPITEVLIEESLLGWKEFELEVVRDKADNVVIICSIENIDPMGVHTGDSVTVAPSMTLTDREYQRLRDQARMVMNAVGVETGGSNVQFAVNPEDGRTVVIEMNPRVSRSSALASKATGFPIAKLAALLAVGYTLDELPNDITKTTVAAFEPSIDYVVAKMPRWAFEKFPGVDPELGPQMKSVGEAMSIGRTFKEALLKGFQSLELSRPPFPCPGYLEWDGQLESLTSPRAERLWAVWEALRAGKTIEEIHEYTKIDVWFLDQMSDIVALEEQLCACSEASALSERLLRKAKRMGMGDAHIAWLLSTSQLSNFAEGEEGRNTRALEEDALSVREARKDKGVCPTFHVVDTCAAEFEASTPYLYSSYETESEIPPTKKRKVMILGGGPNRIGQGIEFDYCCVHAAWAVRDEGYEAIMVNCNPETVSTDYDTSDRLYFEPLSLEHVLQVAEREQPLRGVIVQFGGQTPLNLVEGLTKAGIPILGTPADAIDLAEDRGRFGDLLKELEIPSPSWGIGRSLDEAKEIAGRIGYPIVIRPSYVLGGRAMAIVYHERELEQYVETAMEAAEGQAVLIDQYLEDAYEVDVDAICDGEDVVIGGVMQHVEEAGVHSGDSACVMPPYKISMYHVEEIEEYTKRLGKALGVVGLMNIQYAIKDDIVYILEVNPRASRTVPFVSKATGVPLARYAAQVMVGRKLEDLGLTEQPKLNGFFVKEAVLPFKKFAGVDASLGPEMRSTGEVMGSDKVFGTAFAKAQMAAGDRLPLSGNVLVTVNEFDQGAALKIARDLHRMDFRLFATPGMAELFRKAGLDVDEVKKVSDGSPNPVDLIRDGKLDLIINTPYGDVAHADGIAIRSEAVRSGIPMLTTLSAAQAAVNGIRRMKKDGKLQVKSLQELHGKK